MFKGYKIVSVTPAGRKRYLKILDHYLRKNQNIIDKHIFWVNTKNKEDIEYMLYLKNKYPNFYELEYFESDKDLLSDSSNYSAFNIHNFFRKCIDPSTIYIRFDDDICFIDENALENLLTFRIENPEIFIVYPVIINNCFITNILQNLNISSNKHGVAGEDRMGNGWSNPLIGENLHNEFLNNYKKENLNIYKIKDIILDNYQLVSINCICWFGKEFAKFDGNVGKDEELWLSQTKPYESFKYNAICGNSLVVHFSFFTQKEYFERETNLLENYESICQKSVENKSLEIKNEFKFDNIWKTYLAEKIIEDQNIEFNFYSNQKQKINLLDCTCIIAITVDSEERYENLKFSIHHLTSYFDINIIILEIDKKNKIDIEYFKNIKNLKYQFYDGTIISRNSILNSIYENIDTNIILNYEADFFIYPIAILNCIEKLRKEEYYFAIPFKGKALFYNKKTSDIIKKNKKVPEFKNHLYEIDEQLDIKLPLRFPVKMAYHYGLCWIFQKQTYKKIGFDNPNMTGWGHEDFERYIRTKKLGYDIYHSDIGVGYHLWHPKNSAFYSYDKSINITEMLKINSLTEDELKIYIFTWRFNT